MVNSPYHSCSSELDPPNVIFLDDEYVELQTQVPILLYVVQVKQSVVAAVTSYWASQDLVYRL